MGSSASIMQATLRAGGEEQNSTITFHCQELCESADTFKSNPEGTADTFKSSPEDIGDITDRNSVPVVVLAESSKDAPSNTKGYNMRDAAEVTRYFPILQAQSYAYTEDGANHSTVLVSHDHPSANHSTVLVSRDPASLTEHRSDTKEQRENYYYSCEYCSKRFMFKGCLNRHLARHVKSVATEDIRIAPRSHTHNEKPDLLAEVRYRLKDPRLYEQQSKAVVKSKPAMKNRGKGGGGRNKKWKEKCRLCEGEGHNMNTCKIIPRMLGHNVLAICSCLKCNTTFEDVEQLKEHINSLKCQGKSSWSSETTCR